MKAGQVRLNCDRSDAGWESLADAGEGQVARAVSCRYW